MSTTDFTQVTTSNKIECISQIGNLIRLWQDIRARLAEATEPRPIPEAYALANQMFLAKLDTAQLAQELTAGYEAQRPAVFAEFERHCQSLEIDIADDYDQWLRVYLHWIGAEDKVLDRLMWVYPIYGEVK